MTDDPPQSLCRCTPVADRRFDGVTSPTVAVVEALAAARDVHPTDLPPLNDVVDCTAIDRLFQLDGGPGAPRVLSFSVGGLNVFVRDDGSVRVCDPSVATDPEPVFERPLAD